jgi:hypothetical protein
VARVKKIYGDLGIAKVYADYEERSYKDLRNRIANQNQVPKAVFENLLKKIYKRSK